MTSSSCDVMFSASVRAIQAKRGSRAMFERREAAGGFRTAITPELAAFVATRDSLFLATASADGRPYVQHRGGPPGFLKVLDERTLAFADFRGNRQYITLGNLAENDRAFLFLPDWANRQRIKLWGRARAVEDDPTLLAALAAPDYAGKPEQAIVFALEAWDANCRQHLPQLVPADDVAELAASLRARIAELEAELARLRSSR